MKLHPSLLLAAAALLAAPAAASAQAPGPADEIRVWFTGASNVRSFTCRATEVGASDRLPSVAPGDAPAAADPAARPVTLRIPVARVDCGIPLMNRHLRHALHADRHPTIQFTLAEYELVPGDSAWAVRMMGALAIAGVERTVTVDAAVRTDSAGVVHVTGAYPLRVTDYGIRPPRRFGGLLRVREQVTVHFDVPLADAARPAAQAALPRE